MKPTQQLVDEHVHILTLLQVIDRLGDLASEGNAPLDKIAAAIELVRGYADELHHGKEENLLFPMLQERGMPRGRGPIGCMLQEHEVGRGTVAAMDAALSGMREGSPGAGDAFASAAGAYVTLLHDHIEKENQVLFPWAEDLLSDDDRKGLLESFNRVESEDIGTERVAGMLATLQSLVDEFVTVSP